MHGFRHTHVSMLLAHDVSIECVSERIGHKNTLVTSRVYSHLFQYKRTKEKEKALKLLDQF